jgi:hypothetical protein
LFGSDFTEEVYAVRISDAGFSVKALANGYLIQVTDDIADVTKDYPNFSTCRVKLKALFRDSLIRT